MKGFIDQEAKVVLPAEVLDEMPLPSDPKVAFLGGLFILAMLAAAYVASEIVLPFVFAIVLKLLLQPAFRILERLHVPRILASLLLILALFGTIVGLGTAISGPAHTWATKLPEGIPRVQERLNFLREPINTLQRFLLQVEDFGEPTPLPNAAVSAHGPSLLTSLFTGTRNFAGGFFTTVLFLFFPSRVRRHLPSSPCRDTAALQEQTPSCRDLAANRKRCLCVSGHDHDHERGSRYRYGIGDVAHRCG